MAASKIRSYGPSSTVRWFLGRLREILLSVCLLGLVSATAWVLDTAFGAVARAVIPLVWTLPGGPNLAHFQRPANGLFTPGLLGQTADAIGEPWKWVVQILVPIWLASLVIALHAATVVLRVARLESLTASERGVEKIAKEAATRPGHS
ncbi:MAG: hypothetical protein HYV63_09605 [Candidatus Schekmanbacteria bacterium]|nr:hypothetical protein [Candidatus Schekmanbacteria bacterium]